MGLAPCQEGGRPRDHSGKGGEQTLVKQISPMVNASATLHANSFLDDL